MPVMTATAALESSTEPPAGKAPASAQSQAATAANATSLAAEGAAAVEGSAPEPHALPTAAARPVVATKVPTDEVTVAHPPPASIGPTPPPTAAAAPDDLATVRIVDPKAADHIASFCAGTIASANQASLVAECKRRETGAWTRLVLQNEFPTLDEATRRKCSEPPFPDTYSAKEICARYELRISRNDSAPQQR
jgi:hypothetical protein